VSYVSPLGRWASAFDLVNDASDGLRAHVGTEWRSGALALRGGLDAYDPSIGFGYAFERPFGAFRIDYAFVYDLQNLANPHCITLSFRFGNGKPEEDSLAPPLRHHAEPPGAAPVEKTAAPAKAAPSKTSPAKTTPATGTAAPSPGRRKLGPARKH
jgi:hypothetical protein